MTYALTLESQNIAEDLRHIIKQLESANWRKEFDSIKDQLHRLSQRLSTAIQHSETEKAAQETDQTLRERLASLRLPIEALTASLDQKASSFRQEWKRYRKKILFSYEALAAQLQLHDIHVPSLRPSNFKRNLFHVGNGLMVFALIQHLVPWGALKWVALSFLVWAWSMELLRPRLPWLNSMLMKGLGPFAHPHEYHRVNSATWYVTALFTLSLTCTPLVSALAVLILGCADPAAAIIGRRWGKHQLYAGRSLEGTLTFVAVGALSAIAAIALYTSLSWGTIVLLALGGAVPAAIAELYSKRVDDNLTIPLAAAAGLSVTAYFLNVLI
jgi:dolichol kinase